MVSFGFGRRTQYTQMDKHGEKKRQMSDGKKKNSDKHSKLECKRENRRATNDDEFVRVSRFYDDELNDLIECMYKGISICKWFKR